MQVVEDDQQAAVAGRAREQAPHGIEQQMAPEHGIVDWRVRRRESGNPQLGHQPGQLTGIDVCLAAIRRRPVSDEVAQRLDERLVGDGCVLVAAAVDHRCASRVHFPRQLPDQPRLADSGVAGEHAEPETGVNSVPPVDEPFELHRTSVELSFPAGAQCRWEWHLVGALDDRVVINWRRPTLLGLTAQELLSQPPRPTRWGQSHLLAEQRSQAIIRPQCFGLVACRDEAAHQQHVSGLAVGFILDERPCGALRRRQLGASKGKTSLAHCLKRQRPPFRKFPSELL